MWRAKLKMLMGAQERKKTEVARIKRMFVLFFLAIFLAFVSPVRLGLVDCEIARQTLV